MRADTLVHEWGIITDLLPSDWRDLARSTGALQRVRQVRDPSTLLLLILLHAGTGLSLRQAAARARCAGLAQISDVGLFKRMRGSGQWLQALAARMFATSPFYGSLPGLPASMRVRVVDATTVCKPGSTGTDWRVHYVLRLPSLECDFFEVTPSSGGESYKRVPVSPHDLILADRGYCHRDGAAHVLDSGGDLVVRLNAGTFPLLEPGSGAPLPPLQVLRTLQGTYPRRVACSLRGAGPTLQRPFVRGPKERARRPAGPSTPAAFGIQEAEAVAAGDAGAGGVCGCTDHSPRDYPLCIGAGPVPHAMADRTRLQAPQDSTRRRARPQIRP